MQAFDLRVIFVANRRRRVVKA